MIKLGKRYIVFCLIFLTIFQAISWQNAFAEVEKMPTIKCYRCRNFLTAYGPHNNKDNNHIISQICSVCGYVGETLGTTKLQNCNLCYTSSTVNILNLSERITLGVGDTDFKLQIAVSDNYNRILKCTYVLNEESKNSDDGGLQTSYINNIYEKSVMLAMLDTTLFKEQKTSITEMAIGNYPIIGIPIGGDGSSEPEIVRDTKETKIVTFADTIDATRLKEGLNKITVKVQVGKGNPFLGEETYEYENSNGVPMYSTIVNAYFNVDFGPPVIKNCSVTSTQNSINISTQADSLTPPVKYRYTLGSSVSNWLNGQSSYNIGDLIPNTTYTYKVEAKDSKNRISLPYSGTIVTKAQIPTITAQAGNNNNIKFDSIL